MRVCVLCRSSEVDDVLYGEFLTKQNISVHTYCLYLSSNLVQHGQDGDGFLGFLLPDVLEEADRVKKLVCFICNKPYANIGCCAKKCRKTFHFICGLRNGCENQYSHQYKSYCKRHKRKTRYIPTKNDICCICFDPMRNPNERYNTVNMINTPCCKNGFFHKRCLQDFAKSSGYFCKCPLCNDKDKFRAGIQYRGIFIPNKDASWELEPNAFAELYERPSKCEAIKCVNRQGRHKDNDSFMFCNTCGGHAIHAKCFTLEQGNGNTYHCSECLEIVNIDNANHNVNITTSNPSTLSTTSHNLEIDYEHNHRNNSIEDSAEDEDEHDDGNEIIDVCGLEDDEEDDDDCSSDYIKSCRSRSKKLLLEDDYSDCSVILNDVKKEDDDDDDSSSDYVKPCKSRSKKLLLDDDYMDYSGTLHDVKKEDDADDDYDTDDTLEQLLLMKELADSNNNENKSNLKNIETDNEDCTNDVLNQILRKKTNLIKRRRLDSLSSTTSSYKSSIDSKCKIEDNWEPLNNYDIYVTLLNNSQNATNISTIHNDHYNHHETYKQIEEINDIDDKNISCTALTDVKSFPNKFKCNQSTTSSRSSSSSSSLEQNSFCSLYQTPKRKKIRGRIQTPGQNKTNNIDLIVIDSSSDDDNHTDDCNLRKSRKDSPIPSISNCYNYFTNTKESTNLYRSKTPEPEQNIMSNSDVYKTPHRKRYQTPGPARSKTPGPERSKTSSLDPSKTPSRERRKIPAPEVTKTPSTKRSKTPARNKNSEEARSKTPVAEQNRIHLKGNDLIEPKESNNVKDTNTLDMSCIALRTRRKSCSERILSDCKTPYSKTTSHSDDCRNTQIATVSSSLGLNPSNCDSEKNGFDSLNLKENQMNTPSKVNRTEPELCKTPGPNCRKTPGRKRGRPPGRNRSITPGPKCSKTPGRNRSKTPALEKSKTVFQPLNGNDLIQPKENNTLDISCIALRTRRKSCSERILNDLNTHQVKITKDSDPYSNSQRPTVSHSSCISETNACGSGILQNNMDISSIANRTRKRQSQDLNPTPVALIHILNNYEGNHASSRNRKRSKTPSVPRVLLPKISIENGEIPLKRSRSNSCDSQISLTNSDCILPNDPFPQTLSYQAHHPGNYSATTQFLRQADLLQTDDDSDDQDQDQDSTQLLSIVTFRKGNQDVNHIGLRNQF